LISGFGLPIGEPFDLEALAEECKGQNSRSSMATSELLNIVSSVASPPNALAIM
ncbi:hypothetical protein BJ878DRAFT_397741, partial [Calycina marina]